MSPLAKTTLKKRHDKYQEWAKAADDLEDLVVEIARERGIEPDALLSQSFDEDGKPNQEALLNFARFENVRNTLRSSMILLMRRADETENQTSYNKLKESIQYFKEAGIDFDEALSRINSQKYAKSATHHPTEGLRDVIQFINLVKAAEEPTSEARQQAIRAAIENMLDSPMGATKKNSVRDEIESDRVFAKIHNEGSNIARENIRRAMTEIYGHRPAIGQVKPDLARRTWIYDSDGKNNAEGWAMLAAVSFDTLGAFEEVMEALDGIENEEAQALLARYQKLHASLQSIYIESSAVVGELATLSPAERKELYQNSYDEFLKKQEEFGRLYSSIDHGKRGVGLHTDTLRILSELQKAQDDKTSELSLKLEGAYDLLKNNGLVLQKGQTRQNDLFHIQIIDNLFQSGVLQDDAILNKEMRDYITSEVGWAQLEGEDRRRIQWQIIENIRKDKGLRDRVQELLYAANPLEFEEDGNGYPIQTRTLLDRFKIRSYYPLKFDQGIISDAGSYAAHNQMFIAEIFGMDKMRHMMLNEDRETLPQQPSILAHFIDTAGSQNRRRRVQTAEENPYFKEHMHGRDIHDLPVMIPCSDSTKIAGQAAELENILTVREHIHDIYERAIKNPSGEAIEIEWGCGMSDGRFGGDYETVRGTVVQEMKRIAAERGRPFDYTNKQDRRFMRSAMAYLWTEQGRAKRFHTATAGQIADDISARLATGCNIYLELEGYVKEDTFIPSAKPKTGDDDRRLRNFMNGMIGSYINLRFAKLQDGSGTVLDSVANSITCSSIIGYLNNGARPASKKSGNTKMTGVRAIENNQRDVLSAMFMGGCYGAGQALYKIKMMDRLSEKQTLRLLQDEEFDHCLMNTAITAAARAKFSLSAQELGWTAADFDSMLALGKTVRVIHPDKDGKNGILVYNASVVGATEERAFLAKLFYDRLCFVGIMNALHAGEYDSKNLNQILQNLRPEDGSLDIPMPQKVLDAYPEAAYTVAEHKKNSNMTELMHKIEAHIKAEEVAGRSPRDVIDLDFGGEGNMREIASGYRAGTLPHAPKWSGEWTLHAQHDPDKPFEKVLTLKALQKISEPTAPANMATYADPS